VVAPGIPLKTNVRREVERNDMESYTANTTTFGNPTSLKVDSQVYAKENTIYASVGKHGYPSKATLGSAGLDLRADLIDSIILQPNQTKKISTGLKLALPEGMAVLVVPRSGLAMKHGITVANSPGLIDPDYRGEICVLLRNEGTEDFTIEDGDRIAQLLFIEFKSPSFCSVEELDHTPRGTGGFGSTGV
jgi:dUTP pyrophosphatase